MQELEAQVVDAAAKTFTVRCSPYHKNSALYPVIEQLQRRLGLEAGEAPQAQLARLARAIEGYRYVQIDTVPLLAALLSLPHPHNSPPLALEPAQRKLRTLATLVNWFVEDAENHSMFSAWEDLQWADPSTLELLHELITQVPAARILLVLTFRPDFLPRWGNRAYLNQITLGRLAPRQVAQMIEHAMGRQTVTGERVADIAARTDGVPLFVEELTRMLIDSADVGQTAAATWPERGQATQAQLAIPATLRDLLVARLDHLGSAREIAQIGAAFGREFSYSLIVAVAMTSEGTLQQGLAVLVDAELLYQRGLPPAAHYRFKHALVRDAAYDTIDRKSVV